MNYAPIFATTLLATALATLAYASSPDPLAPQPNGMQAAAPSRHILFGGNVHISPTQTYDANNYPAIFIENGQITSIAPDTRRMDLDTAGYQIHNLSNDTHIYAGFIDPYIEVNAPMPPSNATGNHWSSKVTPQPDALDIGLPSDAAKTLRQLGFTTAMIAPDKGIFRGWSAVVSTAADFKDDSLGDPPTYQAHTAMMMGFDRSSWPDNDYPNSHMGVVALMRQTFIDASHRAATTHADTSCLDEIDPTTTTLFYETNQELEALLADKIANEFNHKNLVIIDNGSAHRRLSAFKDMGYSIITPLRFPKTPEVFSVGGADSVSLAALQHHERAPANARWLLNSGLTVALTTSKGNDHDKFWNNLHTAIEKGLPAADALAMITTNPANILNLANQGTITKNNIANLVIASGDLFDPESDAQIIDLFIDGRRHHINDATNTRFDGDWIIDLVGIPFQLNMAIDGDSITITTGDGDDATEDKARKVNIDHNQISFITNDPNNDTTVITGTLSPDGIIRGSGLNPAQQPFQWTAHKSKDYLAIKNYLGTWNAILSGKHHLTFEITKDTITIIEHTDDEDIKQPTQSFNTNNGRLEFAFDHTPFGSPGIFTIIINNPNGKDTASGMGGLGDHPNKNTSSVEITRVVDDKDTAEPNLLPDLPTTPFGSYAYDHQPQQNTVLLTNATVWSQADEGVLENAWVLIRNGEIAMLGDGPAPRIEAENFIDAKGMHITPGLIDAHSHTGLFRFGVNESGQAITAEVRIADALDPGHPGFYRQLAGGLTTAQLLHGSANSMGGQSQTIKLRWNSAKPSDMFFDGAMPGIKFALGENVKQSNWGDRNTTRYPQTRMGVETLMRDRFTKAREYAADRGGYEKMIAELEDNLDNIVQDIKKSNAKLKDKIESSGNATVKTHASATYKINNPELIPPRDLELETLAQILAGERLIHCHSYRQDEILMLCRLAEEFGFKIGTFQHGLETYKVAEIVKEFAIGTSIFSDWWAYKAEVQDAIPFAGPINHQVGLLTSYNSDSDDVARRMHVEAGKALKYAKLSNIPMTEQEALNFVTMNPAIQLGIDDRVGSLEVGKDADLVVWTGHPLSSLSRPEMTFVDGRLYFSRDMDKTLRDKNNAERQRLIQNILRDGKPKTEDDSEDSEHDHDLVDTPDHLHQINDRGDCGCNQLLPAYNTDY